MAASPARPPFHAYPLSTSGCYGPRELQIGATPMPNKRTLGSLFVSAFLIAAPLRAVGADAASTYTVIGSGTVSCGSWIESRKGSDENRLQRQGWVSGYLSSYNMWTLPDNRGVEYRDVSESVDADGIFAWIDNYCGAHPFDKLAHAVEALIYELGPKWHAAHPPNGTALDKFIFPPSTVPSTPAR